MSTDFNRFIKDAIRTETTTEKVVVNKKLLTATIQMMISIGNVLDQIKKHVFYGKEYNHEQLSVLFQSCYKSLEQIAQLNPELVDNDESAIEINTRLFHGIVGMTTESVELLEALKLDGQEVDMVNLLEELFDSNWYQAVIVDECNGNFDHMLKTGLDKLKERFPDKFDSELAINRNVENERTILEDMTNSNL